MNRKSNRQSDKWNTVTKETVIGHDDIRPRPHPGARPSDEPKREWTSTPLFGRYIPSHVPRTPPPSSRLPELSSPPATRRIPNASMVFKSTQAYPVQSRYQPSYVPRNVNYSNSSSSYTPSHRMVGDPSLKILRMRLPPHLFHLLDAIVLGCEAHAATLDKGWKTELYSLTKQDIALQEIPHLYQTAKPITAYIKRIMAALVGVATTSITTDRNQPHVLKYSADEGHTGVELHHDKCDVTANLCLSRSTSYVGGGTIFPNAGEVVRLEFGEFLLHPGALVHGGMNIKSGTRHLMVIFADIC